MAIPPTAMRFARVLDPTEVLDYGISLTNILEPGEQIASYLLELFPEATALGLTIMSGTGRDHALFNGNTGIRFWLTIDESERENPIFEGGGIPLPMRITADTNSDPGRVRQRTFLVPVAQQ